MKVAYQKPHKIEFGDFQTPLNLAREVCALIARTGFRPASILEPTCGTGSFLLACLETFSNPSYVLGLEINPVYVEQARSAIAPVVRPHTLIEIRQSDFFLMDWDEVIERMPEPLLIVGNPPWVTNAELSVLGSNNIPTKANIDNLRGIDALTGKSNFDISEWMLRRSLEWINGKNGLLAMLCKTTVARRVLTYAWQSGVTIESASLYHLDAQKYFRVSVDAGLLLIKTHPRGQSKECKRYNSLLAEVPTSIFGLRDGILVADVELYDRWKNLTGKRLKGWRSGIKHDASKVFELRMKGGRLVNGFGEIVEIEDKVLFPLLKSSDLAAHKKPQRWLIITQKTIGEDTRYLQRVAPKAWNYLLSYAHLLDRRKSSIYKNRPRFSIFGVGPYSFAPWKVAISGLHKKLDFVKVSPFKGRPVVFDDTCYFFPCRTEDECRILYELVTSEPAQEFLSSLVFWDAKRPITARLLNLLDLAVLAQSLGKENSIVEMLAERQTTGYVT